MVIHAVKVFSIDRFISILAVTQGGDWGSLVRLYGVASQDK